MEPPGLSDVMSTIATWLQSLGLKRYVAAFEAAEIDLDTVPALTEADLRELGLPIGPRRKILAARHKPAPAVAPAPASAPDRRQLTLMFVDLVGSTNMSARFDPEVLSDLLVSYKAVVSEEVTQSEGLVAKYLGDGVLAYFGWPQAREDAAECAIRCAFRIVGRMAPLRTPDGRPLTCRIGVATGLVVVGGETGSGQAREDRAAGEALNLASRLQALAAPGEIIIADSTRRLVGQLFDWEDRGERRIEGFDKPVRVWRALRPATATSRFAAVRAIRSAFVGREEELARLAERWAKACEDEGGAVLVSGEAGIGKSRLCEELRGRIAGEPHHHLVMQCSAFHRTGVLYPVVEHLTNAAEITDADPAALRLEKLQRLFAAAGLTDRDPLARVAELMSIGPEAGYAPCDMAPAQKRAAAIAALVEWIERLAGEKPLFLLLEDGHWSDATTLEFLASLIDRVAGQRVLVVVTGRPEFRGPWDGRPQVGAIGLDRLSGAECETLVRQIASPFAAQDGAIEQIVSRGDGNPLFLEELSLAVLEMQGAGAPAVPDSLQSSLMSRLDMLGDAKEAAQICSVLGRRFARPLLVQVAPFTPEALDEKLETLVSHDILHPLGRASDGRFEFSHALVRDAAYGSLLRSVRRRLHEACGRRLERDFPEVARTEPELLAHHFAEAGQPADASRCYEAAGDRAASRSAFVEAISSYREALNQLAMTPQGDARERARCALLLKLGPALAVIDGVQAPSVGETYGEAEAISVAVDDLDSRFKAVWGLWYHANIGRRYDEAERRAQSLVDLAERSGDGCHRLEAFHCRWSSALFRGDYGFAIADAERGVALYQPELHHVLAPTFGGHDPGVCAHGVCGNALAFAGRFEESDRHLSAGLALAERLEHTHTHAHALMTRLAGSVATRDHLVISAYGERLHGIARRFGFPAHQVTADFFLGWADAEGGDSARGLERMRSVFPRLAELGPMPLLYAGLLADQLVRGGLPDEAVAAANLLLQNRMLSEKGLFLSEVYRARGEAHAALRMKAEAVSDLERAGLIAAGQQSPLFRIRVLSSQIRSGASREPVEDVAGELRAMLADWTGGESCKDFREASDLLAGCGV